jgi:hypothetical protein
MAKRTVSDVAAQLRAWSEQPPDAVAEAAREVRALAGERHGSWFVRLSWESGGLARAVEVAISNATALPDVIATEAFVSVRASASNETAWVAEIIYESRRSLARVSEQDLLDWMNTGASVAVSYTPGALTHTYPLSSLDQPPLPE